jgi:hypothetical protein
VSRASARQQRIFAVLVTGAAISAHDASKDESTDKSADKSTIKAPNGLAFSELRGHEGRPVARRDGGATLFHDAGPKFRDNHGLI